MTIILQILKKLPLKVSLSALQGRFEVTFFFSKALFLLELYYLLYFSVDFL